MKKLVAVLIIVGLLSVVGCCAKTLPDGTVTKSPLNCVQPIVGAVDKKICPTVETTKEAVEAAGFLEGRPDLYSAWLVFKNFSQGTCYLASQLNQALADYDKAPVPLALTKRGMQKPELMALKAAVQSGVMRLGR